MAPLPPTQIASAIFHRINEWAKDFRAGQRQQDQSVDKIKQHVSEWKGEPPSIATTR